MKTLDFSKPLRTSTQDCEVEVVKEGLTLVCWYSNVRGKDMYAAIDEKGVVQQSFGWERPGFMIENVPEPKKDHLHLYRRPGEEWRVNSCLGDQLFTHADAETESTRWAYRHGRENTMIVKVPS